MPQSSGHSTSSTEPSSDFGANEWLVEEMREQYDADPSSVDATWVAYFKNGASKNGGPTKDSSNGSTATMAAQARDDPG